MINILEYLEETKSKYPEKTAVVEGELSITYTELVTESQKIGSALIKSNVKKSPVGVYMEKGIYALCAFFGAAYAGAFYAMLNTELPDTRLIQIEDKLNAGHIITTEALKEKALSLFSKATIYTVEELTKQQINMAGLDNIRCSMIDTDPLYINFTSGSTGTPKGIIISHRSAIDFIDYFAEIFSITENDIIANQAPFDFDVSVKDIYSSVKSGATLVIVPRTYFSSPAKLIDYLCANNVTTLIWAVSALCLVSISHGLDYKTPETVTKIMFSGEVMPYKHLLEWKKHLPDAMYVNLYGPTEITCNCTYYILKKEGDYSNGIPIGKHFPNEDVFLLNDCNKEITEPNSVGKIIVRGTALALGYYNMPKNNEESFIQNPLNPSYPELVYLTGDLGMYNEDHDLIFCGRKDNQVKYMGHRIELEEIERTTETIDGVERCVCLFDSEKEKLKCFYIGNIEKKELHTAMREKMPIFMVPGYIRKLEEFPITKNGKIDRSKLIGG